MLRNLRSRARQPADRGAVLPMFAIFLPVLVVFMTFVLDVGNWFEHQRHLQTQVDAAALAGGSVWSFPCTATTDGNIEGAARAYGGPDFATPAAPYNQQVGGTPATKLHLLANSIEYYNKGGTNYSDGGTPCSAGFIDVKDTELNLPWFLPFGGKAVKAINAHARVSIQQAAALNGLLPLFVRDINPTSAAAIFINDATHTVISSAWMDKQPTGLCVSGRQCYSSAPTNVTVAQRTSTAFGLSSLPRCPQPGTAPCFALPAAGASADTVCNQTGLECFGEDDAGALQAGLVFIRGYPSGGSGQPPNPPILRDVELAGIGVGGATCSDGYFSFTSTACNLFLRAKVDVGTFSTGNVQIVAHGANCPNNGCGLTFDSATGYWTGPVAIDRASASALQPITIGWALRRTTLNSPFGACANNFGGSNTCTATFDGGAAVQRFYRGQDQYSGPIRSATVWNDDGGTPAAGLGANAYPVGSTHSLFATIAIAGGVASGPGDPPIQLRVASNQAAIDCDPAVPSLREELTRGCAPFYTQNTRLTQPDPCDPPYGATTSDLFKAPNPPFWQCVGTQNGVSVGPFADGIQGRVLNGGVPCTGGGCPSTCPTNSAPFVPGRNYWISDWVGSPPTFAVRDDDPRLVLLFMVPFGAFRTSGNKLFPITNFGAFYITGWGGNGGSSDDPCQPEGDDGVPAGWLSGHFVTYKLPSNNGGGNGPCDPVGTNPCVAILTQ
jgi:Putative Flp pilus-assembly TadE/G-like